MAESRRRITIKQKQKYSINERGIEKRKDRMDIQEDCPSTSARTRSTCFPIIPKSAQIHKMRAEEGRGGRRAERGGEGREEVVKG